MIKIQISVTEEQLAILDALAELTELSRARIVRDLLDKNERELRLALSRLEKRGGYLI